ncbi:MAG: glycosyltransferase family 2 protein [Ignavibacteria bacterium]|nr:glycosyltransferase family 2 protein [Ignavibacteria bacterium]MBT8381570.1 glycosyltransferase family 2 protein [Ignavibacteria bacterium]
MSVCAVIPFYNEIETIKSIVQNSLKFANFVIAVNDGSTDNSENKIATLKDVVLINQKENLGKGKALQVGFEKALSLKFKKIISLDADLQHDPKFIPAISNELEKFDIVIGNRLKNLKSMPLQRRLSNKLTSRLLSLKTGQQILDSQCGFRGFNSFVIESVKTTYSGFEAESEFLVLAAKKGFKIGFIDIPTVYTDRKSKMRPLKTILGFLKVLINK